MDASAVRLARHARVRLDRRARERRRECARCARLIATLTEERQIHRVEAQVQEILAPFPPERALAIVRAAAALLDVKLDE
jgi:hypothetical protein